MPESQSCQVLSETWSRREPVHLVHRSPAWVTALSNRLSSVLGVPRVASDDPRCGYPVERTPWHRGRLEGIAESRLTWANSTFSPNAGPRARGIDSAALA